MARSFRGGERLKAALERAQHRLTSAKGVKVGFLPEATYPDGTYVAMVAFWQEYGTQSIPPRPFFRPMIGQIKEDMGVILPNALKLARGDMHKALAIVGMVMRDRLRLEILASDHAALSPVTLMLRKMMDDDPTLRERMSGKTVGEAAARVAAGERGATGTRAKPLVDRGILLRASTYEVLT